MESLINHDHRPRSHSPSSRPRYHSPRHTHHKTSKKSLFLAILAGLSLPILIPTGQFWTFSHWFGNIPVNRTDCNCHCWDTVFKGPYETGIGEYKHVYFNATSNTAKMWASTVIFFIALYELVKHLVLLVMKRRLRWTMGFLLACSIHSHYFDWWNHWNFWNDDFYSQWNHQLFFTLTEILSSALVWSQVDSRKGTQPLPLLIVGSIAAFHVACATWDQFFQNVVKGEGDLHQKLRDVPLMATDCIQVLVVVRELWMIAGRRGGSLRQLCGQRKHLGAMGLTTTAMILYVVFYPSVDEEENGFMHEYRVMRRLSKLS